MSKEGLAALYQVIDQTVAQKVQSSTPSKKTDHQNHANSAFQNLRKKVSSDEKYSDQIKKNQDLQAKRQESSQRLKKYMWQSFEKIQDAMETLENEEEKAWLQENAPRLPGWRNTIRDVDSLSKEITGLTEQLDRRRAKNNDSHRQMLISMGITDDMLTAFEAPDGEEETALAKQIAKLQEEYEWSSYFHEQEVMENIDDYVAKAEEEYQTYTNSEEYAAWKLAKDRAVEQNNELMVKSGVPTGIPGAWETDAKEEELRRNLEYYKGLQASKQDQRLMAQDMEEFASWSEEDQQALISYVNKRNQDAYGPMELNDVPGMQTAQEEASTLIEKYGIQKVNEIAESYMRSQTQQLTQDVAAKSQELADGGFWAGAGHSALSVGANLLGSMTSPLGYLVEGAQRTGRYSTLDPNNVGMIPGVYAGNVRQTVKGNIEESWAGEIGSTVYDAGMSALDNLARIAFTGGGAGSLALAATGTFGQTVSSLSLQGASPLEAVGMGIINGGLEILTEKISLDNLLEGIDNPKGVKETLKAMLRSGGIEVTEEELSFLGSTLAEAVILRENSSYNRRIAELQMYGLTENQAREQAARGVIDEAFQTALQSFLSGGMMEGATSLYSNAMNRMQNRAAEKQLQGTLNQAAQQLQQGQQRGTPDVSVEQGANVNSAVMQQAERISGATGRKIVFYSSENGEDGFFSSDGVIYVNDKGKDPVAQIISHELTHSVEMADAYKELSSLVLKRIEQTDGNLEQMRLEKRDLYARNGVQLNSDADVDSEIVASYVANYLLSDEQSITSLAQENPNLGKRILNWLDGILAKFGNTNAQERTFIKNARDAYARALNQTGGNTSQTKAPTQATKADSQTDGMSMEEMKAWANDAYAAGELSEEEYDTMIDSMIQYEEQMGVDGMAVEDRRFAEKKSIPDKKYSISEIEGEKESYGAGAVLDTKLFDGVSPRNWGKVLSNFVYTNLAGAELTVYDEEGNPESIYLARENDRVRKDGAKNSHLVIDKLARYKGDNIKALATVHLSELLETSQYENSTDEHSHQWMDEKGWEYRKAYIQDRNGNIYEALLNIANGRDRKILYAISNVRKIDKRAARGVVPSTKEGRGSLTKSNSSMGNLTEDNQNVKKQYSISEHTVKKRDVARQLQAIIDRGGDPAELQRYVHSLQGDTSTRGRSTAERGNTGAREILRAARDQGISVEEYLRQNWERYDVDGEWNAEAREALELERRGRRKYSISDKDADLVADIEQQIRDGATEVYGYQIAGFDEGEPGVRNPSVLFNKPGETGNPKTYELSEEFNTEDSIIRRAAEIIAEDYRRSQATEEQESVPTQVEIPEDIRGSLPSKARSYLQGKENKFLVELGEAMGIPRAERRGYLQDIVHEISDEYLRTGTVADDKIGFLFDKAYAEGIVIDREYYDQYKHIKDHLRKTAVTISERDQSDIPDYVEFKKQCRGMIRVVSEGGLPVDSAYHELNSMAPELFPDSVTHPADQLRKMLNVADSIQIAYIPLEKYYANNGAQREEFRNSMRNQFESKVKDLISDLRATRNYSAEAKLKKVERPEISEEAAADLYRELKAARKAYEKVNAKNILTEHDDMQVGRLLRGEIQLEHLDPDNDNVKGIKAIFEAKQEYERISKTLAAYKHQQKAKYQQRADELLETANVWKDKKTGIAYSRETMRRNVLDIIKDKAVAEEVLKEYFEPVQISEAMSTRYKTKYRDRVRELGLSQKVEKGNLVSEAHAVQLLGEAVDNIRVMEAAKGRMKTRDGKTLSEWRDVVNNLWLENKGLDKAKVEEAVEEFRKIYDELFQEMNRVRVRNGYEPVNYRQGYFPHFQPGDGDGIMVHFGKALGIDTSVETLPTTINGMTQTFRPGIQWFGNAQERLGFATAYDAVQGFDKYIEGVANVIFHTENIQKLRAFATQARYRTSEEGLRKQVDAIQADERLTPEERQMKIRDIYEHGKFTLANFVAELDEYTNLLAGKKSRYDRTMEAMMGRRAYTIMKNWESRVGANMIAGNLTSAMTNFIPLTQANARLDRGLILNGMIDTLKAIRQDDGFAGVSDFLTNRRGSSLLVQTWTQKASAIMGTPMELIDNFTSEVIVRAAYQQNIRRGMSEQEAMHQADIFAANVMADRSKGSMPTLLESRNPLFKAFTQFQLEVNNQYSEIFKDLPREYKDKGIAAFGLILLKYFLGAFLYNEVYEYFIGRRPALDPIGMLNTTVGDLTGYELPNLVELGVNTLKGEETSFETEKVGLGDAGRNLANEALSALPFSSGLTLFGIETDGGRVPAASAVPDLSALWDAATGDMTPQQRWKEVQDELNKLAYIIPPFGGNQISKLWKGIKAVKEGGSYSLNQDGGEILQYPVFNDDPEDAFWNMVRASLFGKSSLPAAQRWTEAGFNSLNADQTAVYKDMQEAGIKDEDAYALIDDIRNVKVPTGTAEEDEYTKLREIKGDMILESDIDDAGKTIAFYGLIASDSEKELMDKLADAGADQEGMAEFMIDLKNAKSLKGDEKREAVRDLIVSSTMTDEEKAIVVGDILGTDMLTDAGKPTKYAKFLQATESGLNVDKYMELYAKDISVDDYFEMKDKGLGTNGATDLAMTLASLEPEPGQDSVSWNQQCDAILKSGLSSEEKVAALEVVSYESTGRKVRIGYENGVEPDVFIGLKQALPDFDANGNGSYSQKEVTAAIDAMSDGDSDILSILTGTASSGMNLTNEQKAVLWQLQTGAKDGKNNPYDKEIGKYIYETVQARKEEAEQRKAAEKTKEQS